VTGLRRRKNCRAGRCHDEPRRGKRQAQPHPVTRPRRCRSRSASRRCAWSAKWPQPLP
jgi:hypothetical protein